MGLCDSNGVNLPGEAPSDLPSILNIASTMEQSVFVSLTPATTTSQSSATPEVLVVDEIVVSMVGITTSIACEPLQAVNTTYGTNNVTNPTRGNCGNSTMTVPFTTTKRSTKTTIPKTSAAVSSSAPLGTSTDASGAQSTTVQSGFMLALLGLLMWFV